MGKNTGCGHYVAHIRKEGRWAIFDDRKVGLQLQGVWVSIRATHDTVRLTPTGHGCSLSPLITLTLSINSPVRMTRLGWAYEREDERHMGS